MNQTEFLKIINPFKDKIFRIAKRLLISSEEAEDASQEVFLRLWNKKEGLNKYNSVEALAVTMTKNYCFDQLKSKRASNLKLVHSNHSHREAGIDKQVEHKDSWNWVEKIMNNLPEQQRLIVQMRDVEEYEFSEIAEALEMNETAVRVALSRARKTIKEQLIAKHNYGISTNRTINQ
uniref:RNA polymerase sigma factor n=1 Tax=Flavobacterium sp. TaxID=239 RepID=UPI0040491B35